MLKKVFPFLALSMFATPLWASCGSAQCSLTTDWFTQDLTQGLATSLDLRYEHILQNDIANKDELAPTPHHLEQKTLNDVLRAAFDISLSDRLSVNLSLPVVQRDHQHIHNHHGQQLHDEWEFTRAGDARALVRWKLSPTTNVSTRYGINLGLKLPTGPYDVASEEGAVAERSLQPGSGTTDAILGAYYVRVMPSTGGQWFAQTLYTKALRERANFAPGNQWALDVGYRHPLSHSLYGILQVNALDKKSDIGEEAEPDSSGGKQLFLSPGLSYSLSSSARVYGYWHWQVWEDLNGPQLMAKNAWVAGYSISF